MRHSIAVSTFLFASFVGSDFLSAADELKSGPQPGESIPGPFHYLNINGAHAGNPHCLVCEYGLRPVVLVFVHDVGEKNAKIDELLQKLDEALSKLQKAEFRGGAVFLNDDFGKEAGRQALLSRLEDLAGKLKIIVLAADGPNGPEKYQINPQAEVTVVLYYKHKVLSNFAFARGQLADKEIAAIVAAVDQAIPSRR